MNYTQGATRVGGNDWGLKISPRSLTSTRVALSWTLAKNSSATRGRWQPRSHASHRREPDGFASSGEKSERSWAGELPQGLRFPHSECGKGRPKYRCFFLLRFLSRSLCGHATLCVWALRDQTKNGCVGDYRFLRLWTSLPTQVLEPFLSHQNSAWILLFNFRLRFWTFDVFL